MQQFNALFKKEINAYFKNYFVYMIFFAYLFVSVGSAFYFGAYLSAHDKALYALFYIQPIVLLFFVPAVTMKIWSDEYRSGTAEFLLTLPLDVSKPVLAKFAATVCLCWGMSLFLWPFVFYTSMWLQLDWGNIFSDFAALWLLMAFLCALGCLISAFNRNIVASYLLSVLFISMWLGFTFTGLYATYNNFLFGEVGVPDIAYFVLYTVAFLLINMLVLEFKRSVQKHKVYKFTGFIFLLLLGVSVILAVLQSLISYKFDVTSSRLYTPSKETEAVIDHVYKPINIDLYASKDFLRKNNDYSYYFQQVARFLKKYQSLSEGMITTSVTEVTPYSSLENNILDNGLFYETNKNGSRDYFGAVIRDENNNGVIIKQFLAQRRPLWERDINKALIRLTRSAVSKNIGVYLEPSQNLDEFEGFLLNLESDYNVLNVSSDIYVISSDLDMLILINPKKLPDTFLYAVDQYVMNGGKLLVFLDLYTEEQSDLTNADELAILPLLEHFYVELDDKLTDAVSVDAAYTVGNEGIEINQALRFSIANSGVKTEPLLVSDDQYVAASVTGVLFSSYAQNPYLDTDMALNMPKHKEVSAGEVQFAVVGDVDFIENYLWMDERSVDRNPYSVVLKKDNVELIRQFIDKMLGNDIYNRQPINVLHGNTKDVASQVDAQAYNIYADQLESLSADILQKKAALFAASGENANKMAVMMRVDAAGQEIAKMEEQMDGVIYKVKQAYTLKTLWMMFLNVLLLPLIFTLFIGILAILAERRYRKFIEGVGYEK